MRSIYVFFANLAENPRVMAIINLKAARVKTMALSATGLFFCLAAYYFIPSGAPFKIALPLASLAVAALWLCPWQMCLALLCSAAGDYMGSAGSFIGQMGFFALAHVWMIWFFIVRYFEKVGRDRGRTGKAKGYTAMLLLCAGALLAVVFARVVPEAPAGVIRIGVGVYAVLISAMLVIALLQRSSLYALGAVLFVFSDFILAWNMFVEKIPGAGLLIMIPYYLGQWLLFIRSTPFRVGPEMRLMRF